MSGRNVDQAAVDPGLSATSAALIDVEEDGLRVRWKIDFAFRGGQRESFSLVAPQGFVIDRITGANVRGWRRLEDGDGPQRVEVTTLQDSGPGSLRAISQSEPGRWPLRPPRYP